MRVAATAPVASPPRVRLSAAAAAASRARAAVPVARRRGGGRRDDVADVVVARASKKRDERQSIFDWDEMRSVPVEPKNADDDDDEEEEEEVYEEYVGDDALATSFKTMYQAGGGKRVYAGVFKRDVDAKDLPSEEDAAARREDAATNLTNIDMDERERRSKIGVFFIAVCMALMTYQIPRGAPWNERAILALPLFFAIGFFGSGSTGL